MTDTDVEEEVRAVLHATLEALNNGDRDTVASLLSTRGECTMIGTDAEEWWTRDQLLANLEGAMTTDGTSVRAVEDETFIHVIGSVAWVEGRGRFIDPAGRERGIRMTGVLIKEDGNWKGVQSHASIGVPNDQIFT